jgi:hypothetical protein
MTHSTFFKDYQPKSEETLIKNIDSIRLKYPLIAIHGLFGVGDRTTENNSSSTFDYFNDLRRVIESVSSRDDKIFFLTPSVEPVGNWIIRVIELIVQIKYHYPQWGKGYPVHLFCHSLGSMTGIKLIDFTKNEYKITNVNISLLIEKYSAFMNDQLCAKLKSFEKNRYTSSKVFMDLVFGENNYDQSIVYSFTSVSAPFNGQHTSILFLDNS